MKVTDKCAARGDGLVVICDFSPPRGGAERAVEQARYLSADFICVAYNPGRAVRVDSAMLAGAIKGAAGKDVSFNLATRDMNRLALESHLLGAQALGLDNVVVVGGDPFGERDLARGLKAVDDRTPTGLMKGVAGMNGGTDFRGSKLRAPTDFCIGASIDLARGIESEARLARRKADAGAHFFITQPVFDACSIRAFQEAYSAAAGEELSLPVFYGLQIMVKDGVIFSTVPAAVRKDLEKGRDGTDVALETLDRFVEEGVNRVYVVPPILKGGARDYEAAQTVLEAALPG
jgi:homocysteine S-methyltransferase